MFQSILGAFSAAFLSLTVFAIGTSAATSEVSLDFTDHRVSISGQLIAFDDGAYVIQTAQGIIHVPAILVECRGAPCPPAHLANTPGKDLF